MKKLLKMKNIQKKLIVSSNKPSNIIEKILEKKIYSENHFIKSKLYFRSR